MKNKIKNLIKHFIDNTTNISTLNSRTIFVRENLEDIFKLTQFLPDESKINERLYVIYNDLREEDIICPMCIKNRKFKQFTTGYALTCSQSCATKYQQKFLVNIEEVKQKRKNTINGISDEVKKEWNDRRVRSVIEKYGINAFSKISKKGYATKLEKGTFVSGFDIVRNANQTKWKEIHFRAAETMKNDIDMNGRNHYQRVHFNKINNIDTNGRNHYQRVTLKNYENGVWTKPENKPDFEQYRIKVYREMRKFKDEIKKLENFDKRGHANKGMYHLDHKFSVYEGFKQKIPPVYIGHINNLEMILGRNNQAKSRKCSITKDELIDSIIKTTPKRV